ncbi:hypothetical protein Tco_1280275, partial [Tanacetum coccineum]
MCSDKLYKFCDETLSSVRRVLYDIASNLEMDYLPKRHWINLEMKRSRIMVKEIDKLLFERRLMRNLEKFVGGHLSDTETRNANEREMGDGIPTQSIAIGGASEWSFL